MKITILVNDRISRVRIAIMQPYFLPYVGYFQLINAVDIFVIYDDVQFTKKGWINRNRIIAPSQLLNFTIPCKSSPEKSLIREKEIAPEFQRKKMLKSLLIGLGKGIENSEEKLDLISRIILCEEQNLFKYIHNSILEICEYMTIDTSKIVVSSSLGDFTNIKSQDKIFAICHALKASSYLNPISGIGMYSSTSFNSKGICLESFDAELSNKGVTKDGLAPSIIQMIWSLPWEKIQEVVKGGSINVARSSN